MTQPGKSTEILFLMPPRPEGSLYPWYLREERHSGEDTSFFLAPAMAAGIIGAVRQALPDAGITFHDLQLDPLDWEGLQELAQRVKPGMIVAIASANLLHSSDEVRVLSLPYPTLCVLTPVQADPEEATKRYGLSCRYFSCTDEVEATVASALEEFFSTGDIRTTPGLFIRDKGGGFFTGNPEPSDIGALPMPAYDAISLGRYVARQVRAGAPRAALVNTMKGCPFSCTFCCVGSERFPGRLKEASAMFEEVSLLHGKYGVEWFYFLNSEFSPDKRTAKDFCARVIESGMAIRYTIKERIECVDDELLDLLKKSGCTAIYYGIETADPKVQERIRKKIDLNRAARVIARTRDAGIQAVVFMMLGLPGEDGGTWKLNRDFVVKARPDGTVWSTLFPEHGSPLFEELKSSGAIGENDWSRFRDPALLGYPHDFYQSRAHVERVKLRLQLSYRLALARDRGMPPRLRARNLLMAGLTSVFLTAVFPLTARSTSAARLVDRMKISVSRMLGPIL
jgi:hypothetical protein